MTEETDSIVSRFEHLVTEDINTIGARATIIEVCKAYPKKFFTQKAFKDNLDTVQHDGKTGFSNPYINSILKKLVEEGVLSKSKEGHKAYYSWREE